MARPLGGSAPKPPEFIAWSQEQEKKGGTPARERTGDPAPGLRGRSGRTPALPYPPTKHSPGYPVRRPSARADVRSTAKPHGHSKARGPVARSDFALDASMPFMDSRGSERSADPRVVVQTVPHPGRGARERFVGSHQRSCPAQTAVWHPSGMHAAWRACSGGLRVASTSGYLLRRLRRQGKAGEAEADRPGGHLAWA